MINYWAILVSTLVAMVIGFIWYGPLFGKVFSQAAGFDKKTPEEQAVMKKGMWKGYVFQFIASLLMFYVLAWIEYYIFAWGPWEGMQVAFWMWLGFVLPVKFSDMLWGGSKTLFWLSVCNMLLTLLIAGAIIGAWQ